MRIALIVTCLADALFPQVGQATVRLLERLGHEVVFPTEQTCCGQMHINTGYRREALPLVRHHVGVFEAYDAIVAPSGSCVGCGAPPARGPGARGRGRAASASGPRRSVRGRTSCPSSSSTCCSVTDVGAHYPHRVTYHPTCHSLRMLRVGDKPLQLLRAVDGIDLVELPEAEGAAASAGRSR